MPVVKADLNACQGFANCATNADDVFDVDDDGKVVVLRTRIENDELPRVLNAARSCPMSALWLEPDPPN